MSLTINIFKAIIMKFGIKQILQPTPEQAKKWFNTFFKLTAIAVAILQFYPQIPKHFADQATVWIAESQGFAYFLTRMFGIDTDPSPKLPYNTGQSI